MPIVCEEVERHVELWNLHAIQKQLKRPNTVISKPKVSDLYLKDGTIHYRQPVITEITNGVNQRVPRLKLVYLYPTFNKICLAVSYD
jgi:hypothetical protein